MAKRILLAGESWVTQSTHIKGMDVFTTCAYEEGSKWLIEALEQSGYEVAYLPNHLAPNQFPFSLEALAGFDAVILSDIGSNTLLLNDDVFVRGRARPNRLELLCEYVRRGGGFCMIGGYLSFTGIDGKARYGQTPIASILPVTLMEGDDRCECSQGIRPVPVLADAPVLRGIPPQWPALLGYNRTMPKPGASVIATIGPDPLIVLGRHGAGHVAVFTSDCAPHWGTAEFVAWEGYRRLWGNLAVYLAGTS